MDRSKRLAVFDSSENIRMVLDYRAIVIPAALLSRNPADFRRLVYTALASASNWQRIPLKALTRHKNLDSGLNTAGMTT